MRNLKYLSMKTQLLLFCLAATTSHGAGLLLPDDPSLAALAITYQRVHADIRGGAVRVKVEQRFKNSSGRDLEATYIFPLPPDAGVEEFAMLINGKRVSAELLEKDKAREIYENIVRRLKDPGLLEYMDGNLLQARVYPVPRHGEQKIEIGYAHALKYDHGLYRFHYPLRSPQPASTTTKDFTIAVNIKADRPLASIYSPSHQVSVQRQSEKEAIVGFEQNTVTLDRDFILYYGVADKEIGLGLLAHRKRGEDGYFMMMLTPTLLEARSKPIAKDITFVLDTSGSMAGSKLTQVKNAMTYCIQRLNSDDRFRLIRFSTGVDALSESFLPVNDASRHQALDFLQGLQARGGTAIAAALQEAFAAESERGRPHYIAFLTDGLPTIGITDTKTIIAQTHQKAGDSNRIFVFGVGHDVNTQLLDALAEKTRGTSVYITPEENIEQVVSSFYDKIADPVLADPAISVKGLRVSEIYPPKLPDLFSGGQLTVFGRYSGSGHTAVVLNGDISGKQHTWTYEVTFPEFAADTDFVPRLWARRKIGYLLDAIRLKGETTELKDEVIRLSKEFGIITPYTSFLIVEDEPVQVSPAPPRRPQPRPIPPYPPYPPPRPLQRGAAAGAGAAVPLFGVDQARAAESIAGETGAQGARYARQEAEPAAALRQTSGDAAVNLSREVQRLKQSESEETVYLRHVQDKTFYYLNGTWIDSEYRKDMQERKLEYGSDEYFTFIRQNSALRAYFALSDKLIVVINGNAAVVVE